MDPDKTLDGAAEDWVPPLPRFSPGLTIGHFRIVRELGAGGMGVVLEAHDPDLDRRVAIKIVRGHDAGSQKGLRLIKEAQAMARLTHPNVVSVHEVGTIDGQVFVVMELVDGDTLASWLAPRRPWREIVDVFLQAGDGLAAAHHVGLVHRDFKPTNVLIDHRGRARVGDFGLARSVDEPRLAVGSGAAGTPAYMAPEQRFGEEVDARADQYAYAVSLQEALGPRHAIGSAPRRIRNAITRALAIDPDERFPTLDAMLGQLRAARRGRRHQVLAALGGAAVLAGATAIALAGRAAAAPSCADGAGLVDEVWNPAARADQNARFLALRPGGKVAIETSARLVDAWAASWKLGRRAACNAEPAERAPRLVCLDRALHDLRAQVAVWNAPDAEVVDRAVSTASGLPQPDRCALATDTATTMPPEIATRLARIRALQRAGKAREAQPEADALLATEALMADPAIAGPILLVAGMATHAAGDFAKARALLVRAGREAGKANDTATMLEAMINQVVVVTDAGRPQDGLGILDAIDAINALGDHTRAERLMVLRGSTLTEAGRLKEAVEILTRAVDSLEAHAARTPAARVALASALGNLAAAHNQLFEFEKAYELLKRTLAIEEVAFGPNHPEVGKTLHDQATNAARLERWDEAHALIARSRKIFVEGFGERHPMVGACEISRAGFLNFQGDLDGSRAAYLRAKAALEGVIPADHPMHSTIEEGLGSVERDSDRCDAAIPHFEAALAMIERIGRGGTDHALQLINLGACQHYTGKDAEARRSINRALQELAALEVPERDKVEAYAILAEIDWNEGQRVRAIGRLRQVLAIAKDSDGQGYAQLRKYAREQLADWTKKAR